MQSAVQIEALQAFLSDSTTRGFRRSVARTLRHRSGGSPTLRKWLSLVVNELRARGISDADAQTLLVNVVLDVARGSGHDRIDLITGLPRYQFVVGLVVSACTARYTDDLDLPTKA